MNIKAWLSTAGRLAIRKIATVLAVPFFLWAISSPGAELRKLQGHVPPVVSHLTAIGRLPATNQLRLAICVPLRDPAGLDKFLAQLYDPANPNFHHYLTSEEFTGQFGPTAEDYEAVVNFAKTNGLELVATCDSRMLVDVRGKVSDIETAFHVILHIYQHPTESRRFYAPDVEPSVDSSLRILKISGLNDYPTLRWASHQKTTAENLTHASGSAPDGHSYLGNDIRNAFVPGVSLTGGGQIVGLFAGAGYWPSDIAKYEALAGLPNVPLQNILVDGFNGSPATNDANGEVSLDIEMAIAMAPGLAKVVVFEGDLTSSATYDDMIDSMATHTEIKQFSSSFGTDGSWIGKTYIEPIFDQAFAKMAAQGQSFFWASGDGDAYTNPIWFDGDSPYVTSVGGTTLTMNGSGTSYASETVWNSGYDTNGPAWGPNGNGYWGSGGGVSTLYVIPSWQQGISTTANQGSTSMRNVPDVALLADDTWVVYNNGKQGSFMGTSIAAPLWAGFIALVNQRALQTGSTNTAGFINPAVYTIGKGIAYTSYSTAFHDITTGGNTWPGSPTNYYAVPGYALCTGWGTPNGMGLIAALSGTDRTVWVDFNFAGVSTGSYEAPYKTLGAGATNVPVGGTVAIKTAGSSPEILRITKAMKIEAVGGNARIGP